MGIPWNKVFIHFEGELRDYPISDIGEVDEKPEEEESESAHTTTNSGRIVGGLALESYDGCIKCHGKVAPDPRMMNWASALSIK